MQREASKLRFLVAVTLLVAGVMLIGLLQLLYGALAFAAGVILLHYAPIGDRR